ncbi:glycerol-3-phosphate acyltransferase [Pseudooceanicola nanhaiensis]|jgi:glycerol-3-phosphate acyltransferase PlsY|uniref:Glycerol-3-phosphate acyltransferase n=1 Tax=Pseudooceanicola nanhaiensis TaxID=375761 RepID=A0A917WFB1_9RHOB|nr:glycerol-3-phosphate 1-O-acyltransferase PlsY [Pseudooceanicola nanhaiensis]GGL99518.1 glycerol-3-phosphate acyltransferase [Pseudooceanicola nanhaiensis]
MPELVSPTSVLILWAVLGYLLGSIPFGILLSRAFGLGDLRKVGSGNIGATNVLRTGNKKAAAATLIFDGLKGAAAVLLARYFAAEDAAQLASLLAFIGHCFPVWLGFKGGKGVATFLGVLLALVWPVGLACCATWLVMAFWKRISSLAALAAAASSSFWAVLLTDGTAFFLCVALTVLVFIRHGGNIRRLFAGTEPRIGQK